jgi:phospholipid/cholesterol/gamma-HCH transport system substrate-binding protein
VKRAIAIHRRDFTAIIALLISAIAVSAYILVHQPAFTIGHSYYTVSAAFQTGAAVTAGQGQTIDVAGVQIGEVGGVSLHDGQAVVKMNIDKKYAPIYKDATVLLRPRTPLKDMYLELDPGTKSAGAMPAGGELPVAATNPDVNFDEILASLDTDTRNYLLLLLSGGAQLFHNGGATGAAPSPQAVSDLRGVFQRFAPLNRDTAKLTRLLAERQANIRRSIHNLGVVTGAIGDVGGQLTSLIRTSDTNFSAISAQDEQLSQALTLLPPTLEQTTRTLGSAQNFANESASALHGLIPFAKALSPALSAARPLFEDTTSVIQNQLRPFSRAVQPVARILAPASAELAKSTPPLTKAIGELNTLFNELAYKAKGSQSYLYWGSWLSHIAMSLTRLQDAHGPLVQGIVMGTCSQLNLFEVTLVSGNPALGPLISLLNPPDWSKIKSPFCPSAVGLP